MAAEHAPTTALRAAMCDAGGGGAAELYWRIRCTPLGPCPDQPAELLDRVHVPTLDVYAWPGAYPITYWDSNTDNFCGDCAMAIHENDPDEPPMSCDIVYEGPATCTDCGRDLSAYPEGEESGDPIYQAALENGEL